MTAIETARSIALTALVAALGAGLFWLIGFPAAPLTGSAAAVSVAGLMGLHVVIPVWLRNTCFIALGINIGTGVTREALAGIATWPLSLAIMAVALLVALVASRNLMERAFGYDRTTATLASTPGHLSFVLSIALDKGANTSVVGMIQSIRVLFLTLALPLLVERIFGATGLQVLPSEIMGVQAGAILIAGALVLSVVFTRLNVPAAFLLGGMIFSAVGHVAGLTPGRLPDPLITAAFLMMGALIGSRFSGQDLGALRKVLAAGCAVTAITAICAAIGVGLAFGVLGVSPALLIVAFAPGGVEAMAAIAVQLGLDPTFVATHHVIRLAILSVLVPVLMARISAGGR
jgi:membrane AbrB-like protein